MCQEKLVQEAVDTLLDNRMHGQPMRNGHNKVYKSFLDIIEGKEGRFYETLLKIAIELFQTFIIRGLIRQYVASKVGVAKSKFWEKEPIIWEILQGNTSRRYARASLEGRAICFRNGFNEDFDGDQMVVHVPLSLEARAAARLLMFSHMNLLSPAIRDPIYLATQDMLMRLYVLMIKNC
ncbi:hypothetical protein NE237_011913 [Protea cynaroides]|uniref:DNA-directed RNA polymerase n=1 Tax=Protea cynaroides TaxID=273540 RepID=A0A9Q0JYD2_9MAGN|nr:hypothetical protein NE237_011913 [Protea cynaroides]